MIAVAFVERIDGTGRGVPVERILGASVRLRVDTLLFDFLKKMN